MSNIDYQNGFAAGMATNGIVSTGSNEVVEQIQADWLQTDETQPDFIKNKPEIPEIPEIPEFEQVQADWNQTDETQPDFIKNKPEISETVNVDNIYNLKTIAVDDSNSNSTYSSRASTYESDSGNSNIQIIDTNNVKYLNDIDLSSDEITEELDDNGNIIGITSDSEFLPFIGSINLNGNLADLQYYFEEYLMEDILYDILGSSKYYDEDINIFYEDSLDKISRPFDIYNLQTYKRAYLKDNKLCLDLDYIYNWIIGIDAEHSSKVEKELDSSGKTIKLIFAADCISEDNDLNINNFKIGVTEDFQISYYGTLGENFVTVPKENSILNTEDIESMFSDKNPESVFGYFGEDSFFNYEIPVIENLFNYFGMNSENTEIPKIYFKCNDGFKFGVMKIANGEYCQDYLQFTDYVEVDFSNIDTEILIPSGIFITGDINEELNGRELKLYIGTDPNCGANDEYYAYTVSNSNCEFFIDDKFAAALNRATDGKFIDSSTKTIQNISHIKDDNIKIDLSNYPNRLMTPMLKSYSYDVIETFETYNSQLVKDIVEGLPILRNQDLDEYIKPGRYILKGRIENGPPINIMDNSTDNITNVYPIIRKSYVGWDPEAQDYTYNISIDTENTVIIDHGLILNVTEYAPTSNNINVEELNGATVCGSEVPEFYQEVRDPDTDEYVDGTQRWSQLTIELPNNFSYVKTLKHCVTFDNKGGANSPTVISNWKLFSNKDLKSINNVADEKYVKLVQDLEANTFNGKPSNTYNIDTSGIDIGFNDIYDKLERQKLEDFQHNVSETSYFSYTMQNLFGNKSNMSYPIFDMSLKTFNDSSFKEIPINMNQFLDGNTDLICRSSKQSVKCGTCFSVPERGYSNKNSIYYLPKFNADNSYDYNACINNINLFTKYYNGKLYLTYNFCNFSSIDMDDVLSNIKKYKRMRHLGKVETLDSSVIDEMYEALEKSQYAFFENNVYNSNRYGNATTAPSIMFNLESGFYILVCDMNFSDNTGNDSYSQLIKLDSPPEYFHKDLRLVPTADYFIDLVTYDTNSYGYEYSSPGTDENIRIYDLKTNTSKYLLSNTTGYSIRGLKIRFVYDTYKRSSVKGVYDYSYSGIKAEISFKLSPANSHDGYYDSFSSNTVLSDTTFGMFKFLVDFSNYTDTSIINCDDTNTNDGFIEAIDIKRMSDLRNLDIYSKFALLYLDPIRLHNEFLGDPANPNIYAYNIFGVTDSDTNLIYHRFFILNLNHNIYYNKKFWYKEIYKTSTPDSTKSGYYNYLNGFHMPIQYLMNIDTGCYNSGSNTVFGGPSWSYNINNAYENHYNLGVNISPYKYSSSNYSYNYIGIPNVAPHINIMNNLYQYYPYYDNYNGYNDEGYTENEHKSYKKSYTFISYGNNIEVVLNLKSGTSEIFYRSSGDSSGEKNFVTLSNNVVYSKFNIGYYDEYEFKNKIAIEDSIKAPDGDSISSDYKRYYYNANIKYQSDCIKKLHKKFKIGEYPTLYLNNILNDKFIDSFKKFTIKLTNSLCDYDINSDTSRGLLHKVTYDKVDFPFEVKLYINDFLNIVLSSKTLYNDGQNNNLDSTNPDYNLAWIYHKCINELTLDKEILLDLIPGQKSELPVRLNNLTRFDYVVPKDIIDTFFSNSAAVTVTETDSYYSIKLNSSDLTDDQYNNVYNNMSLLPIDVDYYYGSYYINFNSSNLKFGMRNSSTDTISFDSNYDYEIAIYKNSSNSYDAYFKVSKKLTDFSISENEDSEITKSNLKSIIDRMYEFENLPVVITDKTKTTIATDIFRNNITKDFGMFCFNSEDNYCVKLSGLNLISDILSQDEIDNIEIELDIEYKAIDEYVIQEDFEITTDAWVSDTTYTDKLGYNFATDIEISENYGPNSVNKLKFTLSDYDRELKNISTFFDYISDTTIRIYAKELPTENVIIEKLSCTR